MSALVITCLWIVAALALFLAWGYGSASLPIKAAIALAVALVCVLLATWIRFRVYARDVNEMYRDAE